MTSIKRRLPDNTDAVTHRVWEDLMKHAHEIYLERRLACIDLEIEEAQRQTVVSIAHVGEIKRRRLHIADELAHLRETHSPFSGSELTFRGRSIVWV